MPHEKLEEQIEERAADLATAKEQLVASEMTLEEQLRFERLVSNLSFRCTRVAFDQLDLEIEHALKQILEFFEVDRCFLVRLSEDKTTWQITHAAHADVLPPIPIRADLPTALFPWVFPRIVGQHEVLSFSTLEKLPAEASVDKQSYREQGIRSFVHVPLLLGDRLEYFMSVTADRREYAWPAEYIPRLRLLGEIFVNALERRQRRLQLEDRLRFETLLADISARFVNLPPDQMDAEIEDGQRRICELFGLDRSALWQAPESEPGAMVLTHMHQPPGGPPVPERMDARDFFPWAIQKLMSGEHLAISKLADLPPEAARDREVWSSYGTKSTLVVPLSTGGGNIFGVLSFAVMREERDWQEPMVKRLRLVAELFANALARKQMEEQLRRRLQEIEELKQRLETEKVYLEKEMKLLADHAEIVGQGPAINKILAQVEQVAQTDSTVLILGETGTGKELLARAIHRMSSRKDRPLVTVNCASLPPTLIESELFGRERGAYTGALTKMIGRFEIADGSTLFLDEIGEIPLDLQSKLLRVLEEGHFERLGSTKTLHVNVRIIAATNRDIAQDVKEGKFRKDLFYRLNVFPITVPPLRERREDIPLMVWAFVKEFQKKMGKEIEGISRKTMEALQSHSWPGNVRELRNAIEHAMIVSGGKTLVVPLPKPASWEADATRNLEDIERRHIVSVLEGTSWRVAGKDGAAEVLGLKRSTLYSKMKKLGIHRPSPKASI